MTDPAPHSLKSVFCIDVSKPLGSEPELAQAIAGLKAASAIPADAGEGVARALDAALEQVMAVQLGDILLASWGKLAAFAQALEATHADPNAVVFLPLMDHKVTSSHAPCIDLLCAGKELAKLAFDISVVLELKGVELELRRGAVSAIRAGKAVGTGKLGLAGKTLLQRTSPPLPLPGRLAFTPAAKPASP